MSRYNSQQTQGDYRIQFFTDSLREFHFIEEACRRVIDHKPLEFIDDEEAHND